MSCVLCHLCAVLVPCRVLEGCRARTYNGSVINRGKTVDQETFRQQIEYALGRIRDVVRLRSLDLGGVLVPGATPAERGWELSRLLLDAIDMLRPEDDAPEGSWPQVRYALLSLRFVNGMTVNQAASHLSLSRRHFYRLLHQAIDEFTDLLWARVSKVDEPMDPQEAQSSSDAPPSLLARELATISSGSDVANVDEILEAVSQMLEPLRKTADVHIEHVISGPMPAASVSAQALKQILLGLLGDIIKRGEAHSVQLTAERHERWIEVSVLSRLSGDASPTPEQDDSLQPYEQIARLQGISLRVTQEEVGGTRCHLLRMPIRAGRKVVVVDDNAEVRQLLMLYLNSGGYEPIIARNGQQAIELAQQHDVFAITLDLMMSEEDGWDVLQALRHHPLTESVPVVVCSVLDQRELALMLGADDFVKKPIMREALLSALAKVTLRPDLDRAPE